MTTSRAGAAGAIMALGILAQPASADEIANFYKGKNVSIVVGHQVGTGHPAAELGEQAGWGIEVHPIGTYREHV